MEQLNLYGDSPLNELNGYGIDISMQRIDDLDAEMLKSVESSKLPNLRAIDLGCGQGGQSLRIALRNCDVTAVDIQDFSKEIAEGCMENKISKERIHFIKSDIQQTSVYLAGQYNFIYSQRAFHYIDYKDLEKLLKILKQHFVENNESKLFASVSGLETELGENYEDKNKPISNRFCHLDRKIRNKHKILLPVCLYRLAEFEELLVKCKYSIEKIYQSDFGNIKAIAKPI